MGRKKYTKKKKKGGENTSEKKRAATRIQRSFRDKQMTKRINKGMTQEDIQIEKFRGLMGKAGFNTDTLNNDIMRQIMKTSKDKQLGRGKGRGKKKSLKKGG